MLFNGTGTKLAGTDVGTSVIDSFRAGFERVREDNLGRERLPEPSNGNPPPDQ